MKIKDWIKYPTTLSGQTVDLISLDKEHFRDLHQLAAEKRIWEFYAIDGSNQAKLSEALHSAITEREKGSQYPFVVFHREHNKVIGSTRLLDLQPVHKKLEIGWTWLHPEYWASEVNLECKLLLLEFCFEDLGVIRVQLKTDENNTRSRKAIEKIGGKYEGVLRNEMLRDNGTKRNSAYYSIIDEEWKELKSRLTEMYNLKQARVAR